MGMSSHKTEGSPTPSASVATTICLELREIPRKVFRQNWWIHISKILIEMINDLVPSTTEVSITYIYMYIMITYVYLNLY